MKSLIFLFFSSIYLFGITPFSLENIKEVNVNILNKKEVISKDLELKLERKIIEELQELGIKTQTENYINFIVKISIDNIKDVKFVRTSIMISEDVAPLRDKELLMIAITYKKSDSFEAEDLEVDIYESIIDYLFEDFKDQYKDEN